MAVGRPHRLDRVPGEVGDGVLEQALLHARPRVAEEHLDEGADAAWPGPPEQAGEQDGLRGGPPRAVDLVEAGRQLREAERGIPSGPGTPARTSAAMSLASR